MNHNTNRFDTTSTPRSRRLNTMANVAVVAFCLALAGCTTNASGVGSSSPATTHAATTAAVTPTPTSPAPAGALPVGTPMNATVPTNCHVVGSNLDYLPDPTCTPGATNPGVTQANIQSTICVKGYTKTIRPVSSWTTKLKKAQMAAWGITGSTSTIEEDHLVSLELGGAPSDSRNLWPEQGGIPNVKDKLENKLNKLVCSGSLSLTAAQNAIASNWETAYTKYVGPLPR